MREQQRSTAVPAVAAWAIVMHVWGVSTGSKQAELICCMQMVQLLEQEAEKLLMTTKEPVSA